MNQYSALPELAYDFKIKSIRSPGLKLQDKCFAGIKVGLEQGVLRARIVFSNESRKCADKSDALSPLDISKLWDFAIPVTRLLEKGFDPYKALYAFLETTLAKSGTLLITLPIPGQDSAIITFEHAIYRGSVIFPLKDIVKYFDTGVPRPISPSL